MVQVMSDNDEQWTVSQPESPEPSYKGKRSILRRPNSFESSSALSKPPEELSLQLQSRVSLRNVMKASKQASTLVQSLVPSMSGSPGNPSKHSQRQPPQTVHTMEPINEETETITTALMDASVTVSQRLTITLPPKSKIPGQKKRALVPEIEEISRSLLPQSTRPTQGLSPNLQQIPLSPMESDPSEFAPPKRRRPDSDLTRVDGRPSKRLKPTEPLPLPGTIELQNGSCMSRRYQHTKRCTACISKKAGEPCRFRDVRAFVVSSNGTPGGTPIFTGIPLPSGRETPIQLQFNNVWYSQPAKLQVQHIKTSAARILLPTLIKERECLKGREFQVIRRTREVEVRVTCDCCATSVFSVSFICTQCGREFCLECHTSREPVDRVLNQGLVRCGYTKSGFATHGSESFLPVSRLAISELDENILEMERVLANAAESQPPVDVNTLMLKAIDAKQKEVELDLRVQEALEAAEGRGLEWNPYDKRVTAEVSKTLMSLTMAPLISTSTTPLDTPTLLPVTPQERPALPSISTIPGSPSTLSTLTPLSRSSGLPSPTTQSIALPAISPLRIQGLPSDPASIESLPVHSFHYSEFTDGIFQFLWKGGETMVVTDLLHKMNIEWTPEYFIEHYGDELCAITNCDTNKVDHTDVRSFFQQFGNYSSRGGAILKLKDWPPTADFKTTFPVLFDDFHRAVPAPSYTRRDGFYNISAHFPLNAVVPDMGPKMYNAFKSKEEGYGSTRLHMDMADAVNIMLYSAPLPGEIVGYAVWDIYPSASSSKIRAFLKEEFPLETCKVQYVDPIHSQYFYLTPKLRKKLFDKYGVQSWRIYQKPGDAVFIPAGCAHQVCNLADCVKVAVDFVSPENLSRCGQLTKEFRSENEKYTWKEDILQLSNMCWSAWENTRQMEQSMVSAKQ